MKKGVLIRVVGIVPRLMCMVAGDARGGRRVWHPVQVRRVDVCTLRWGCSVHVGHPWGEPGGVEFL